DADLGDADGPLGGGPPAQAAGPAPALPPPPLPAGAGALRRLEPAGPDDPALGRPPLARPGGRQVLSGARPTRAGAAAAGPLAGFTCLIRHVSRVLPQWTYNLRVGAGAPADAVAAADRPALAVVGDAEAVDLHVGVVDRRRLAALEPAGEG